MQQAHRLFVIHDEPVESALEQQPSAEDERSELRQPELKRSDMQDSDMQDSDMQDSDVQDSDMQDSDMQSADSAEKILARQAHLAYAAAVKLLARRDHSTAELTRKLQQREHTAHAIDSALEELIDANYLNDRRYAELYAEQRMNRGFGPRAIRSKLQERGIDAALTSYALRALNADWSHLAESLIHNRYNAEDILDESRRTTARIARFLQARGFASGDALRALNAARKSVARPPDSSDTM